MVMMKSRVVAMEEGKESANASRTSHTKVLPLRFLQLFLLFLALGLVISIVSIHTIRFLGGLNLAPVGPFFQSCYEDPNGLEKWVRPPSNLMHTMNDTELFWRASFVPQRSYPFTRVPKIAFMFLTKGPLPMAPLWERFFKDYDGLYSIYVHAMPSYVAGFPPSSVFYRRQVPSQVAEWGMMSLCDAERRLLANALLDISNEWFILLSESCIPLHNFSTVYQYISSSHHSFMDSFDDPGPYGRGRYNENMAPEVNLTDWRKGSQWFEVNRELALKIVADTVYYPKFKEFCQPACYVDEHYFQTMLGIQTPSLLANRTLTFVDWSRGGAHPATFGKADIKEEFLRKLSSGKTCIYNNQTSALCHLFARKFAPSTLEPLLELASQVLGI